MNALLRHIFAVALFLCCGLFAVAERQAQPTAQSRQVVAALESADEIPSAFFELGSPREGRVSSVRVTQYVGSEGESWWRLVDENSSISLVFLVQDVDHDAFATVLRTAMLQSDSNNYIVLKDIDGVLCIEDCGTISG